MGKDDHHHEDNSAGVSRAVAENPSHALEIENTAAEKKIKKKKPRIREKRRCRDIVVLAIFIAFWIGMVFNSFNGWLAGDPRRLVYGLDYKANFCGSEDSHPDLRDYDVRYWLNPNQVYDNEELDNPINLIEARSICLKDCPVPLMSNNTLKWVCDYPEGPINITMDEWANRNYDYFDLLTEKLIKTSLKLQGPCYPVLFNSSNLSWSCQFEPSPEEDSLDMWKHMGGVDINVGIPLFDVLHKSITSPSAVVKRYAADLEKAWPVLVLCGAIAPLLLSIIWLVLVRYFVGVIIWLTIIFLNLLAIAVTLFCYIKAGWIGRDAVSALIGENAANTLNASSSEETHLKAVAIAMTIILLIVVIVTLVLIKRVIIAIAVIKVSAKAIGTIPSLIIFPVFPFIVLLSFLIYWVVAALYILSAGDMKENACHNSCCAYDLRSETLKCEGCCGYDFHFSQNMAWSILYHIFGCFWTTQFIIACSLTTIAGAVGSYYWARGDTSDMPIFPVLTSAKRVFRYSLGSMALGSLLVAIIETIRFILEAIQRRLKAIEAAPGGSFLTCCCCCAQCCLSCIESIIKFINRNAYIMIAITGKGFCRSAGRATSLVLGNILRIGTVNVISDIIIFLGKICISLASALLAFVVLDTSQYKSGHKKVSSPLLPVLFCWGTGFVVASLFFAVVEMAIDTIILSFCEDAEEHDGTPVFAPPLLMETLGKHTHGQAPKH